MSDENIKRIKITPWECIFNYQENKITSQGILKLHCGTKDVLSLNCNKEKSMNVYLVNT